MRMCTAKSPRKRWLTDDGIAALLQSDGVLDSCHDETLGYFVQLHVSDLFAFALCGQR